MNRCDATLDEGHRRAGEVCGRRCMAPHTRCEMHRPKHPGGHTKPSDKERERFTEWQRNRRRSLAGLPPGWEGL